MNQAQEAKNVLAFPKKTALFNQELKSQLKTGLVSGHDIDPVQAEQLVNTTEQVICTHVVSWAREFGTKIGNAIGEYFTK